MTGAVSLLERVQLLLERTYLLRTTGLDVGSFVVGDAGYRRIYGGAAVAGSGSDAARTLVRETPEGLRACIYYPDGLIRQLERHPPWRGVHERNVDAFATLVEELDHLLCIADRAAASRPLTLFELELHANVSKHLVLARYLAGREGRLGSERRAWLRFQLFEKMRFCDDDVDVAERYRDAARWAVRFLDALREVDVLPGVDTLRRFHAAGAADKLRLIRDVSRTSD